MKLLLIIIDWPIVKLKKDQQHLKFKQEGTMMLHIYNSSFIDQIKEVEKNK